VVSLRLTGEDLGPSSSERSRVQRKEDVQNPQAMKTMEKNIMKRWMEQRRWNTLESRGCTHDQRGDQSLNCSPELRFQYASRREGYRYYYQRLYY
jgi:hypothetical protein